MDKYEVRLGWLLGGSYGDKMATMEERTWFNEQTFNGLEAQWNHFSLNNIYSHTRVANKLLQNYSIQLGLLGFINSNFREDSQSF